jgi:hypothetical protein
VVWEPKYCPPCIPFSLHPVRLKKGKRTFGEEKQGQNMPAGWKEVYYDCAGNQWEEV